MALDYIRNSSIVDVQYVSSSQIQFFEKFFMSSWLTQIIVLCLLTSHVNIFINKTIYKLFIISTLHALSICLNIMKKFLFAKPRANLFIRT